MRVLLVTPSWGTYGGIQAFIIAVAKAVAKERVEPVLCFKRVAGTEVKPDLLRALADYGGPVVFAERGSLRLLSEVRKADVVHLQTPAPDVAAMAAAMRRPLAVTFHNHRSSGPAARSAAAEFVREIADRRWYHSRFVARTWNFPEDDPTYALMPGQADLPAVSGAPLPPAERSGFIFVARWIENKGLEDLVEAYGAADLDRQRHPLVLLGDGPLRPRVEALIRARGLADVTTAPGFLPAEERDRRLARARWLVAPANCKEDLGLTPIEARHLGVPCVVTADGGLPEAAGRHALICTPGDREELRLRLEEAAAMSDDEYATLASASREELLASLTPLETYAHEYRRIAAGI